MASPERKSRLDISEVPPRGRLATGGGFNGNGGGGRRFPPPREVLRLVEIPTKVLQKMAKAEHGAGSVAISHLDED
ncbi:MAG: hypothetical protein V4449_02785 [Patescibacteria group bacterium]